jgi:signal recognition particle receptor subunit alpha
MLDAFEILTTSGIVLWSRSNINVNATVVNSLINDVFIEEKVRPAISQVNETFSQRNPSYRHDKYTLKWTLVKDLGLIFVVLIYLEMVPRPISNEHRLFTNRYSI